MKPTTRIAQIVATVRKVCYADDLDTRDLEGPSRTPTHLRLYLSLYTHTQSQGCSRRHYTKRHPHPYTHVERATPGITSRCAGEHAGEQHEGRQPHPGDHSFTGRSPCI